MKSTRRNKLRLTSETLYVLEPRRLALHTGAPPRSGECWTDIMPCTERTLLGCSVDCYTFNRC